MKPGTYIREISYRHQTEIRDRHQTEKSELDIRQRNQRSTSDREIRDPHQTEKSEIHTRQRNQRSTSDREIRDRHQTQQSEIQIRQRNQRSTSDREIRFVLGSNVSYAYFFYISSSVFFGVIEHVSRGKALWKENHQPLTEK